MKLLRVCVFAVLLGACLVSCDTLKIVDVTLDITGNQVSAFTGYYWTTGTDTVAISGTVPKSYTFQARKSLDIVAAEIVRVGAGQLTAKIVSEGITRASDSTSDIVGTVTLEWVVK